MTVLLAALFVFNAFDLALTQSQLPRGNFVEANCLAVAALAGGAAGAVAHKAVLLGIGVAILYRYRRHLAAEIAAWGLTACCAALMVWWEIYLDNVEICLQDPCVASPPMFF